MAAAADRLGGLDRHAVGHLELTGARCFEHLDQDRNLDGAGRGEYSVAMECESLSGSEVDCIHAQYAVDGIVQRVNTGERFLLKKLDGGRCFAKCGYGRNKDKKLTQADPSPRSPKHPSIGNAVLET